MSKLEIITQQDKYISGWTGGLPETPCGYGSKLNQTSVQRKWIPEVCRKHGIQSLADIGAGDLNWIKRTDLTGIDYAPYDLVPRAEGVQKLNILKDTLPQADCLMLLWVINHFPEEAAQLALERVASSGAKWLMMTYEPRMPHFTDLTATESVVIRDWGDQRGKVELRLIPIC